MQRLSVWSKAKPVEDEGDDYSDEDDTEIQRLDDDEGFVDFTKVGRAGSIAGSGLGGSTSSGSKNLKNMLGNKFKNRVSVIKRDSVRKQSLKAQRLT